MKGRVIDLLRRIYPGEAGTADLLAIEMMEADGRRLIRDLDDALDSSLGSAIDALVEAAERAAEWLRKLRHAAGNSRARALVVRDLAYLRASIAATRLERP